MLCPRSGGALGAAVTHLSTKDLEERRLSFEARKAAYADFFEAIAGHRKLQHLKKQAARSTAVDSSLVSRRQSVADTAFGEFRLLWDKGRFQIGVFSDGQVVKKLAKYLGDYFEQPLCKDLDKNGQQKFEDDVATYQAIRREMKTSGEVTNADLALVLFGCRLDDRCSNRTRL